MKLQLYVLRQLLVSLAFSVGGLLLVALPGIAVRTVHEIPSATALHLAQFLALSLQNLVPYVLPICFLLATVATYGRLAADREWVAIQMAGVRPSRLLLPSLGTGALLGGLAFLLLALVVPHGKTRQRDLILDVTSSALTRLGPGGTSFSLDDGALMLEALTYDEETGLLHEVFLRSGRGDGGVDYHADRARISLEDRVLHAEFFDLFVVRRTPGGLQTWKSVYVSISRTLEPETPSSRPRYQPSPSIARRLAAGEVPPGREARYRFELHYRGALAAIFLVFAVLGPATGLIARRGTQLGALSISSAYALLHYLLQMQVAKDLGTEGVLDPALAAWAPVGLGLGGALLVARKALRR